MCSRKDDMSRMCYRYPKLHVSYDIDEELLEFSVPNFILQPSVEIQSLGFALGPLWGMALATLWDSHHTKDDEE